MYIYIYLLFWSFVISSTRFFRQIWAWVGVRSGAQTLGPLLCLIKPTPQNFEATPLSLTMPQYVFWHTYCLSRSGAFLLGIERRVLVNKSVHFFHQNHDSSAMYTMRLAPISGRLPHTNTIHKNPFYVVRMRDSTHVNRLNKWRQSIRSWYARKNNNCGQSYL